MKVRKAGDGVVFKCPGCGDHHHVRTEGQGAWGFNGNMEAPTLTPSLLVTSGHYITNPKLKENAGCYCNDPDPELHGLCYRCHSFITDGKIRFLEDCTHSLKGQTVELSEIKDA